jgi:hypothetical protein
MTNDDKVQNTTEEQMKLATVLQGHGANAVVKMVKKTCEATDGNNFGAVLMLVMAQICQRLSEFEATEEDFDLYSFLNRTVDVEAIAKDMKGAFIETLDRLFADCKKG